MDDTFFNCTFRPNQPIYNFFEESLFFDGLSNLMGYRRFEALATPLDPWVAYQRIALTITKIFLYLSFPTLVLFSFSGKAICHYLEPPQEAPEKLTQNQTTQSDEDKDLIHIDGRSWLSNYQMSDYCFFLRKEYGSRVFFPHCGVYKVDFFSKDYFSPIMCYADLANKLHKNLFDFKAIVYPVKVGKDHWALLYIDRVKRTVEYYDSKVNYGNHDEFIQALTNLAKEFTKRDEGDIPYVFSTKINKKLQPDSYQCGPWVLYFLEHRLQNPDVDFNQLDIDEAQKMIEKYRFAVRDKLLEMEQKKGLFYCRPLSQCFINTDTNSC